MPDDILSTYAQAQPDKPAVIEDRPDGTIVRWTYAELEERSNRLANLLLSLGAGPDAKFWDFVVRGEGDFSFGEILDSVENAGMTHQRVDPWQEDITRRAPAEIALVDRRAEPMLEPGKPIIALCQLGRRQCREREQVAVIPVLRDLARRQHLVPPESAHHRG